LTPILQSLDTLKRTLLFPTPQEETSLKSHSWILSALLLFGCGSALAQKTYSLGFLSYDQKTQFCDYEVISVSNQLAAGTHNLQDCPTGSSGNGIMVGVQTANLKPTSGSPVTGKAYAFADNAAEVGYNGGFACGCAVLYITKTVPTPVQSGGPYGWALYFSIYPGEEFLGTYGFLTKQLGGSDPNQATFNVIR